MATIAFCGLGKMGVGMAGRLIDAGHDVTVWNRSPERADPLIDRGAALAANPAAAADGADAIFSMVADDDASLGSGSPRTAPWRRRSAAPLQSSAARFHTPMSAASPRRRGRRDAPISTAR